VTVTLNSTVVGSFLADQGYISPGPEFVTFDVTGLLLPGLNTLDFTGSGLGDYVVGQVDLTYTSNAVPEPSTMAIAGVSLLVGLGVARRRRRS
jgi:MYXO-CTERM domain-containing protein